MYGKSCMLNSLVWTMMRRRRRGRRRVVEGKDDERGGERDGGFIGPNSDRR